MAWFASLGNEDYPRYSPAPSDVKEPENSVVDVKQPGENYLLPMLNVTWDNTIGSWSLEWFERPNSRLHFAKGKSQRGIVFRRWFLNLIKGLAAKGDTSWKVSVKEKLKRLQTGRSPAAVRSLNAVTGFVFRI